MKASLLGAAVAAVAPLDLLGGTKGRPKKGGAELKISLQEGVTPGETLKEKLDFMENHGVVGLEPNGAGLAGRVGELKEALRGREVKISAICAGFGDLSCRRIRPYATSSTGRCGKLSPRPESSARRA